MANTPDVIPAIFGVTSDSRARTSMTFGAGLESGWSDTATNPSGATGPFQILLPVHPDISFSQAEDPVTAAGYMLPAYRAALNQVPSGLWGTNPEVAAERTVILAEQPGGPFPSGNTPTGYGSEGVDVVNQRWGQTTQFLTGAFNPGTNINLTAAGGFPPNVPGLGLLNQLLLGPLGLFIKAPGQSGGGTFGAIGKVLNFLSNPQDAMERIGLILFGAVLVIVGLYALAQGTAAGRMAKPLVQAAPAGAAMRLKGAASGANAARQKQVGLQSRAMDIGERRVKVQEARQQRLSATSALKAPAVGKHAKGGKSE